MSFEKNGASSSCSHGNSFSGPFLEPNPPAPTEIIVSQQRRFDVCGKRRRCLNKKKLPGALVGKSNETNRGRGGPDTENYALNDATNARLICLLLVRFFLPSDRNVHDTPQPHRSPRLVPARNSADHRRGRNPFDTGPERIKLGLREGKVSLDSESSRKLGLFSMCSAPRETKPASAVACLSHDPTLRECCSLS